MPSKEQMIAAFNDFWAAVDAKDVDRMLSNMAEDAEFEDPVGSPVLKGHGELRKFFDGMSETFKTVSVSRDKVYPCADQVGLVWTISGRMTNGRDVTFDGIDIIKFNEDGNIQALWGYWDPSVLE